jgi:hypothetical protein
LNAAARGRALARRLRASALPYAAEVESMNPRLSLVLVLFCWLLFAAPLAVAIEGR